MKLHNYLIPSLKALIKGNAGNYDVNIVVKTAQQFATIKILQIIKKHPSNIIVYPHTVASIALDSVAELFEKNEDGYFIEFTQYFSDERDLKNISDDELLHEFRKLVFFKTDDGIYRLYRERDPLLSKIIRNLKLAVKKSDKYFLFSRFGDLYIGLKNIDEQFHLPAFQSDELEKSIKHFFTDQSKTSDYLDALFDALIASSNHRKSYSLIDSALIIKSIIIRQGKAFNVAAFADTDLVSFDLKNIVSKCAAEIRSELHEQYVNKNKIAPGEFSSYMSALEELLVSTYIHADGTVMSHYEYLKKYLINLSYDEYRNKYRNYFEYFVKFSRNIIEHKIKDMFI